MRPYNHVSAGTRLVGYARKLVREWQRDLCGNGCMLTKCVSTVQTGSAHETWHSSHTFVTVRHSHLAPFEPTLWPALDVSDGVRGGMCSGRSGCGDEYL